MPSIRVLIVDDSVVVRRILGDFVAGEPDMEVAGVAATASIGIQKISQVNPDIVILDVEMPGTDGIEAVRQIRQTWPKLPVLMCSSLTERGADTTLRALAAGATDYVAKPTASASLSAATFRADLVSRVRALAGVNRSIPSPAALPLTPLPQAKRFGRAPVSALLIGSSTGGPSALGTIFAKLPGNLPVPILLVQHMPPLFTRLLAERLTASSPVKVTEAAHGDIVEPGRGYIAPGGHHMVVVRDGTACRLLLNQDPPENSCRPAVDVLFRSAAKIYGAGCLGVVLTGMGHDGTRGARDVVEAGGRVITQDAATCVVPSMPTSVANAGLSDGVRPLPEIASEIITRVHTRGDTGRETFTTGARSCPPPPAR